MLKMCLRFSPLKVNYYNLRLMHRIFIFRCISPLQMISMNLTSWNEISISVLYLTQPWISFFLSYKCGRIFLEGSAVDCGWSKWKKIRKLTADLDIFAKKIGQTYVDTWYDILKICQNIRTMKTCNIPITLLLLYASPIDLH